MTQSLFDRGAAPPCPAPFNLAAYVLAAGQATPDKPALELISANGKTVWTYRDLRAKVLQTAGGLQALGLPPGALILMRLGNEISFPVLFLAAIAAGYVPVPTSSQLTPPEVRSLVDRLQPALTIYGAGIASLDLPGASLDAADLGKLGRFPAITPVPGDPNRLAYIIMTSGTSGQPRAVEHAHRAVWARRMMWTGWYGLRPDDRLLHAGAFNWTFTLGTGLMDPWAIGATAVIPDPDVKADALLTVISEAKATIFAAAPGVYRQMLKGAAPFDAPNLRHGLSAGEKLPPALQARWQAVTGTEVYEALGMSEISTFISSGPGRPAAPGATGQPQTGRRVAVIDPETSAITAPGQPGILAIDRQDPGLMLGYRNAPQETAEKLLGDWFLTGDTVSMDQDGQVTYLGRQDDMMNAGGYRVSPLEVESVLNSHPQIIESAAVSVEIKADVQVIAAFYQAAEDLSGDDLAAFCAARLARYKCPRLFQRIDALPKGANNKLKRSTLRATFRGTHDPA